MLKSSEKPFIVMTSLGLILVAVSNRFKKNKYFVTGDWSQSIQAAALRGKKIPPRLLRQSIITFCK